MLKHVRLATKEEVEKIREGSNFGPETVVWAMDQGPEADLAVIKRVVEMDPIYFAKSSNDVQKAKFVWALEERMMGGGVGQYFFNVRGDDERWQKVVENWGAQKVSLQPDIRYMKTLVE